uniref:Uncharacterized protein n=1 Tax=Lygus hesperus TaxID=30085 RepID=A0A146LVR2_LYGHE
MQCIVHTATSSSSVPVISRAISSTFVENASSPMQLCSRFIYGIKSLSYMYYASHSDACYGICYSCTTFCTPMSYGVLCHRTSLSDAAVSYTLRTAQRLVLRNLANSLDANSHLGDSSGAPVAVLPLPPSALRCSILVDMLH